MTELRCAGCGNAFGLCGPGDRAASISASILGDECTETWYYCPRCDVYTVEVYWDVFLGEDSVSTRGPIAREEGERQIALILQCATPWLKTCRCPAHRAYFGDVLD